MTRASLIPASAAAILVIAVTVIGLPTGLAAVAGPVLLILFTVSLLWLSPATQSLAAAVVLVVAMVRTALDRGGATMVVVTASALAVFFTVTLPARDSGRPRPGPIVAVALGAAAVSAAVIAVSTPASMSGVVPFAVGLAATLAAYWLCLPSPRTAQAIDPHAEPHDP